MRHVPSWPELIAANREYTTAIAHEIGDSLTVVRSLELDKWGRKASVELRTSITDAGLLKAFAQKHIKGAERPGPRWSTYGMAPENEELDELSIYSNEGRGRLPDFWLRRGLSFRVHEVGKLLVAAKIIEVAEPVGAVKIAAANPLEPAL